MSSANSTGSYLDPPQLLGRPNADGTISITPLELKRLNDFNYYVAKMLQGGLNLANLNAATNEVFTGMVTFTDLSTGGSTIINGDNVTTGTVSAERLIGETLQGVTLLSEETSGGISTGYSVEIENGGITLDGAGSSQSVIKETVSGLSISESTNSISINSSLGTVQVSGGTLIFVADGNASFNAGSGSTIYIGTSNFGEDVTIGNAGGDVRIVGNIYHNGSLVSEGGV